MLYLFQGANIPAERRGEPPDALSLVRSIGGRHHADADTATTPTRSLSLLPKVTDEATAKTQLFASASHRFPFRSPSLDAAPQTAALPEKTVDMDAQTSDKRKACGDSSSHGSSSMAQCLTILSLQQRNENSPEKQLFTSARRSVAGPQCCSSSSAPALDSPKGQTLGSMAAGSQATNIATST